MLRMQYGIGSLKWLMADDNVPDEPKRHIQLLIDYLSDNPTH